MLEFEIKSAVIGEKDCFMSFFRQSIDLDLLLVIDRFDLRLVDILLASRHNNPTKTTEFIERVDKLLNKIWEESRYEEDEVKKDQYEKLTDWLEAFLSTCKEHPNSFVYRN